jgi:hypothetical protein
MHASPPEFFTDDYLDAELEQLAVDPRRTP